MKRALRIARKLAEKVGLDVRPIYRPGSSERKIGNMRYFLEDLASRGYAPYGFLDVGAHKGSWTLLARSVFPGVPGILVEPQEELQAGLIELSIHLGDIEIVQAGAGAAAGQKVQTIWEDLAGSSFLPAVQEGHLDNGRQRMSRIITLDSLLERRPQFVPSLIKLDIQGYEVEALKGGLNVLRNADVVIIEVSLYEFIPGMPTITEVIDFLSDQGFSIYDVTGFLRRPHDGALGQLDLAFAKKGQKLMSITNWS